MKVLIMKKLSSKTKSVYARKTNSIISFSFEKSKATIYEYMSVYIYIYIYIYIYMYININFRISIAVEALSKYLHDKIVRK